MDIIPQNFKGPSAAGTPKDFIPYYAYGHASGNEQLTQPGPWAAGSLPYAASDQEAPTPPEPDHWAKFVFNQVDAGQTVSIYSYYTEQPDPILAFVDWGDGTTEPLIPDEYGNVNHVYATGGKKTIYLTGTSDNVDELSADKYFENGNYQGPSAITVDSTFVEYLYIDSFPATVTISCPAIQGLYIGDRYTSAVGNAQLINALVNSLPSLNAFFLLGGLNGPLDLRASTVPVFYVYNYATMNIPAIYLGASVSYVDVVAAGQYMSVGTFDFTACTSLTNVNIDGAGREFNVGSVVGLSGKTLSSLVIARVSGLSSLNLSGLQATSNLAYGCPDLHTLNLDGIVNIGNMSNTALSNVSCSNSSLYGMDYMLQVCAQISDSVMNGTFTGTGNGAPFGNAITDKATLISRGWTVTTD